MKAITLWQPWASLLACGAKQYETRSWATEYKGTIAIHAAKKDFDPLTLNPFFAKVAMSTFVEAGLSIHNLPFGCIIATAELVDCHYIHDWKSLIGTKQGARIYKDEICFEQEIFPIEGNEYLFGDWTPGRYAWEFENMKMLPEPIPAKGKQRLWNWDGEIPEINIYQHRSGKEK